MTPWQPSGAADPRGFPTGQRMKSLLLLGSTGSIGTQTLDLVERDPSAFRVLGLCARRSWEPLLDQALRHRPLAVGLTDEAAADQIADKLPAEIALVRGPDAARELAATLDYELAVQGIVGAAGVRPSETVLSRGKPLALANKESLVVAGAPLMELARRTGARILPVDSEHAAVFQCLGSSDISKVRCIWLTASGGPFRDRPLDTMAAVTPAEALQHPNWDMGPRITVGSATLMNKALEVVEAHHLFGLEAERIKVVLHRQSLVHSMVEFVNGSVLAQLGPPDMRHPIHQALYYPDCAPSELEGFSPARFSNLTFEEVDRERFPTLDLGYACLEAGQDAGAVLNASDEVAVEAFLAGRISFTDITAINRAVLERRPGMGDCVDALLQSDARARIMAGEEVSRREAHLSS
ncbi:MAG: 1-deoxy-D-xylulose-5-phosphate reductoisomerase [Planctomycetota bacterium]|jgi:1-deoxy-D-xylulose-5-phosphate reductoisomerase